MWRTDLTARQAGKIAAPATTYKCEANQENEMIDPKLSELADRLQVMSDNSYIRYLDRCRADECLGHECKMEKGSFGRAELDAHKLATEALGKHKAYQLCANELRSIIAALNKEPT